LRERIGGDVNHSQDDQVLEEATRRLVTEFSPSKVYLFGSRSRGDASPDSDYDFLVVVSSSDERPLRRAQRAYRALRGLGIAKDVIVTTAERFDSMKILQASLEHEVFTEGRLLYG
jgi:predicted nucleotidyltransferase